MEKQRGKSYKSYMSASVFQKITKDEHQSKVDFNVFEGKTVHGVAEHVICQGWSTSVGFFTAIVKC